ncbi:MAG: IS66 family insertion sequence element accessory protein TnpB [Gammaproteobacteria bacterium]|nr:IS66 family insertion sequence element accessory protein TnpB [Gammaproteobacteria bacterium]
MFFRWRRIVGATIWILPHFTVIEPRFGHNINAAGSVLGGVAVNAHLQVLRHSDQACEVFLYRDAVDFRKSYRGLAALVQFELERDPADGALYVFINRHRTRIKILLWERNGFVLYYKALSEDRFCWPFSDDDSLSQTVDGQSFNWLLDGIDLRAISRHQSLENTAFF